jgi:predicted deacylase
MTHATMSLREYDDWCNSLELRSPELEPGRRHDLVRVSEGIDASPICVAAVRVDGRDDGPRVWLQAQTHGDEPNPTAAVLEVLRELSPQTLRGTVVALPAMHSAAVRHFSRESPLDGKNGNRIWGIDWRSLGHTRVFSYIWMDRISNAITQFQPDLVIDFHDGGIALQIMSHVLYDADEAGVKVAGGALLEELAVASGMEVVWKYKSGGRFGGSIGSHMRELGFPSMMLESGGTGAVVAEDVSEMADGLRNVLRAIGSLPDRPRPRHAPQLEMTGGNWVRTSRAGLFRPTVGLRDRVAAGQPIGVVADLFDEVLEEVRSPIDGLVFGLRHVAVANMGDYVANVGQVSE